MKTIHTRDFNNQGNKISCTVDVKDGEDVITSEVIEFRSKDEMNGRLKNILNIANEVAEVFPTLTAGEWTAPIKMVDEPVIVSVEELTKQEQFQKEMELRDAIEKAEWKEKAEKFSTTDTLVAAKLEAFSPRVTTQK